MPFRNDLDAANARAEAAERALQEVSNPARKTRLKRTRSFLSAVSKWILDDKIASILIFMGIILAFCALAVLAIGIIEHNGSTHHSNSPAAIDMQPENVECVEQCGGTIFVMKNGSRYCLYSGLNSQWIMCDRR